MVYGKQTNGLQHTNQWFVIAKTQVIDYQSFTTFLNLAKGKKRTIKKNVPTLQNVKFLNKMQYGKVKLFE